MPSGGFAQLISDTVPAHCSRPNQSSPTTSDFEAFGKAQRRCEAICAFDLLSDDSVDMRDETLQIRKLWLGKLLKRSTDGIIYNDHDAGATGPRLSEHACLFVIRVGASGGCIVLDCDDPMPVSKLYSTP